MAACNDWHGTCVKLNKTKDGRLDGITQWRVVLTEKDEGVPTRMRA